jgi:hypothetical protein
MFYNMTAMNNRLKQLSDNYLLWTCILCPWKGAKSANRVSLPLPLGGRRKYALPRLIARTHEGNLAWYGSTHATRLQQENVSGIHYEGSVGGEDEKFLITKFDFKKTIIFNLYLPLMISNTIY